MNEIVPPMERDYEKSQNEITALLGVGTEFQGRLSFEGTVRIDGIFRGDIFTRDTLIVGPDARVEAHIQADTVIVAGYVEGEVHTLSRVEIQKTGYIRGSVLAPVFRIEEGGMFDGSTQMIPSQKDQLKE